MSYSIFAISYFPALAQLSREKSPLTNTDRLVEHHRVYGTEGEKLVVVGNPSMLSQFEKLKKRYLGLQLMPEDIIAEISAQHPGDDLFAEANLKISCGVVSLKDFLSRYSSGSQVQAQQVEALPDKVDLIGL